MGSVDHVVGKTLVGFGTAVKYLSINFKVFASSILPATNNAKVIKNHFFGENDIVWRYDFYKTHILTEVQVRKILDTDLFSAYKQSSLIPKYLLQANMVRNYTRSIVANAIKN